MPPAAIRRPVSITLWLVLSIVTIALSPLLLAVTQLIAVISGDQRPYIIARVCLTYFIRELTTLVACGVLWLLAGCGLLMRTDRIQSMHWRLLEWFAGGIAGSLLRTLQIEVVHEVTSQEASDALHGDGPLLVLSRHAGPADTILLVGRLLSQFGRRPSVVFKELIALDPSVDLIAHRLPHAVLDVGDAEECQARIAEIASAMGTHGALLLFPEGGNFSPQRRRAAVASLRRHRRHDAARAADRMQHVMAPRPAGTVAALRANPEADVVFAAHTGLGIAAYAREIWRALPVGAALRTRMWFVPRAEIPAEDEDIAAWLTDWWLRIDGWIDGQGTEA